MSWNRNARVNTLNFETMLEMKKANRRFLIVEFESADNTIPNNIKFLGRYIQAEAKLKYTSSLKPLRS